jgi:hypothetical protein
MTAESKPGIDLYWLPLGAGGHSVRLNGRVFEAVAARLERRRPCDLYHSALEVRMPEGRFVIEQAPSRAGDFAARGVVAEGPVGSRWAGRLRIFRYEVRRWRGGTIPDVDEAVESPQRLTDDPDVAQCVLDLAPHVPTAVWGRDELAAGEMWNSNSVIAWLLARSGVPTDAIRPPAGGRAPGWSAGLVVASRQGLFPPNASTIEIRAIAHDCRYVARSPRPFGPGCGFPAGRIRQTADATPPVQNQAGLPTTEQGSCDERYSNNHQWARDGLGPRANARRRAVLPD